MLLLLLLMLLVLLFSSSSDMHAEPLLLLCAQMQIALLKVEEVRKLDLCIQITIQPRLQATAAWPSSHHLWLQVAACRTRLGRKIRSDPLMCLLIPLTQTKPSLKALLWRILPAQCIIRGTQ
jgi:hypothetical protein